jgi:hypothetical protein
MTIDNEIKAESAFRKPLLPIGPPNAILLRPAHAGATMLRAAALSHRTLGYDKRVDLLRYMGRMVTAARAAADKHGGTVAPAIAVTEARPGGTCPEGLFDQGELRTSDWRDIAFESRPRRVGSINCIQ